jgi:hypothetical protein
MLKLRILFELLEYDFFSNHFEFIWTSRDARVGEKSIPAYFLIY